MIVALVGGGEADLSHDEVEAPIPQSTKQLVVATVNVTVATKARISVILGRPSALKADILVLQELISGVR